MLTIFQTGNESLVFNVMIVSVFNSKRESSVTNIPTKCMGRPLALGDYEQSTSALVVAVAQSVKHKYHGHYKTLK